MASKTDTYQNVWHSYVRENGGEPISARACVEWGLQRGMIALPKSPDPIDIAATELSQALRRECTIGPDGEKIRLNHAVSFTSDLGVQYTLWGTMANAPPEFIEEAFRQRRKQIEGDVTQLARDISAYRRSHKERQFVMSFDFTDDLEKKQIGDLLAA